MSMNKGKGKTVVTRMERRRMRARQRRIRICAVLLVLAVVVLTGSWVVIGAGKEISEADRSPQEIRVEALTVEAIEDGPEPVKLVEREEHQEGEDPLEAEKIEAALVEQGYWHPVLVYPGRISRPPLMFRNCSGRRKRLIYL